MRAYSAASEEALRTRNLLKDWAGEGFLSEAQYQRMEQETICELRRINVFLRLVLFLFTLIIVGAAVGLFFVTFLRHVSAQAASMFLLIFAAISYAAAEFVVSRRGLYRYGIEEALATCSVGFLCAGIQAALSSVHRDSPWPAGVEFLVPAAGAIASLWLWHRFGFVYAFLAAMIFVPWLSVNWTSSHPARHLIVAALYAAGLTAVVAVRSRHRYDYLNDGYSIVEALLWLGIYLAINLQLSSVSLLAQWWGGAQTTNEFSRPFYWGSWVLTWCLPPAVLARGVLGKDQFVISAGAVVALLTLVTNKPYLGWQRQTWDPMLLGALMIGVALLIRRWLAKGPGGIHYGLTAHRLSGKDQHWMNAASFLYGLEAPHSMTLSPQTNPNVRFGGGDSGGGGATSDF